MFCELRWRYIGIAVCKAAAVVRNRIITFLYDQTIPAGSDVPDVKQFIWILYLVCIVRIGHINFHSRHFCGFWPGIYDL